MCMADGSKLFDLMCLISYKICTLYIKGSCLKIGVITTSRADYGIYFPLLKEIESSNEFELKLFCLGMHVSSKFGKTIDQVRLDNFSVVEVADTLIGDSEVDIALSMGKTAQCFIDSYKDNQVDLIICLGDRYEMFAAVSSLVPFNVKILHIHGGEETLGAIDNKFRHALTTLSDYHLVTCEDYLKKVISLGAKEDQVLNTGSLSISSLNKLDLYSKPELSEKYNVDTNKKIYMVTYHPVTVSPEETENYIDNFLSALKNLDGEIIITGTNADTENSIIKSKIDKLVTNNEHIHFFESLGKKGYFSFLAIAHMMLGNSSSGIIEAASFNLPVVDIGRRQEGRKTSNNLVHSLEDENSILSAIKEANKIDRSKIKNIYSQPNSVELAMNFLKKIKVG